MLVNSHTCTPAYFANGYVIQGDPVFSQGIAWAIYFHYLSDDGNSDADEIRIGFSCTPHPRLTDVPFEGIRCTGIVVVGDYVTFINGHMNMRQRASMLLRNTGSTITGFPTVLTLHPSIHPSIQELFNGSGPSTAYIALKLTEEPQNAQDSSTTPSSANETGI